MNERVSRILQLTFLLLLAVTMTSGPALLHGISAQDAMNFEPIAAVGSISGVVFAQSDSGVIYGVNAVSGAELWRFDAGSSGEFLPVVAGGMLFVGNVDCNLFALKPLTGTVIWEQKELVICYPPVVVDKVVFLGAVDGNLYALNSSDGSQIWEHRVAEWGVIGPTVAGGRVFAGSRDESSIVGVDAANGAELWRYEAFAPVQAPPIVAGDIVLAATYAGAMIGLDAATGQERCVLPANDVLYLAPPEPDGMILAAGLKGGLYSIDPISCSLNWLATTGLAFITGPTVEGGVAYFASPFAPPLGGVVIAVEAATGVERWRFTAAEGESPRVSQPGDGAIAVSGNQLYALDAASGAELWRFAGEQAFSSPPKISNATVFQGSVEGTLYAIDLATGALVWELSV